MPNKMEQKRNEFAAGDERKLDLRIVKTRKALRSTLVNMMEKTPIEEITVQDLCEEASINRMTFYKHYEDKYALLRDCLNDFRKQIRSNLETHDMDCPPTQYCLNILEEILYFCGKHRGFIRTFIKQSSNFTITLISDTIREMFTEMFSDLFAVEGNSITLEYGSAFIAAGVESVIAYSMSKKQRFTPREALEALTPIINEALSRYGSFLEIKKASNKRNKAEED